MAVAFTGLATGYLTGGVEPGGPMTGALLHAMQQVPVGPQIPVDGKSWVGHRAPGERDPNLPPDGQVAEAQLAQSPRRAEWVDITTTGGAPVRSFIVHRNPDTLPGGAVIVIHENAGLTDWIRGVADQFAYHGFTAVAPDLLSGKGPNGGGTDALGEKTKQVTATLTVDEVVMRLNTVRDYAREVSETGAVATVGFGWGGTMSFTYALQQPELDGAVSFYGSTPTEPELYADPRVRILGLYPSAESQLIEQDLPLARVALGDLFSSYVYLDAVSGFLRDQTGQDGANLKAATWAWPETIAFLNRTIR
jgi:carboxymethylenebutenolidase